MMFNSSKTKAVEPCRLLQALFMSPFLRRICCPGLRNKSGLTKGFGGRFVLSRKQQLGTQTGLMKLVGGYSRILVHSRLDLSG